MAFEKLPATLTPREAEQMNYDERMFDKQAAFQLKQLEIEAKWTSWLKIPVTIIKLPVYVILGIGVIIAVARKHDPPKELWEMLRR